MLTETLTLFTAGAKRVGCEADTHKLQQASSAVYCRVSEWQCRIFFDSVACCVISVNRNEKY